MMKSNKLRTYPIKPLTIFLSVVFVISTAMLVVFMMPFTYNEQWVIKILIYVFCGIFSLASLIVLIYELFFYIEIKEDYLIKHVLFGFNKVKISDISSIKNQDGFYVVMVKGRRFATFATNTVEASKIIVYLEKYHVKIDW